MAGIIVDVSQDIKKLQDLKAEIEEVKKELRGINVSVKIDIKDRLEKQLKSLTDQYNTLSEKVSETEGKIMLSLKNIDKTTDKIIQAQAKLTSTVAPSSLNTMSNDVSLETVGVKEQAKAYDELKLAIESIAGVRSNNITRMLREQEQMKLYQQELKELEKAPRTDELNKRFVVLAENIERSKIAISELRQAVKKDIKLEMAAPNSVDALSQSLSKMKDVWKGLSPEELESPFGKELTATIQQADDRIKELSATIGEHQRKVGNYENATKKLRIEQRDLIEEIAELTLQYRAMSNAEKQSGAGKELEKKISTLTNRAAQLKDAMADVNREVSGKASDTSTFSSINEGINLIISGFGAATGAANLLGLSEEDLLEIQTKLQAAYVASNALVRIQNTLQKESNLMIGIGTLQSKAAAKAIAIETAAKSKGVIVTKAATVAQAALNLVAKANPYLLLAGAIISVVGALWAFSKGQSEAKRKAEEFNKGVAETATSSIAKIEELSIKWNRLGDNLAAKKKFVEDNKKAFNDLGISILDVVDAENVLNNNKDAFIKAMIERAKAAQYIKQQEENIKELIEAERNLEATKNKEFEDKLGVSGEERKRKAIEIKQYEYDEIAKKIKEGYTIAAKAEEEGAKILDNARIKSTENAENLVDDYTYKMMTGLERGKDNYDSFIEYISKGYMSLIESIQDETTTFGDKIGNVLGSIFSFKGNGEDSRLTIGERITQLKTDYAVAQNKLKGLREANSKASQEEINDAEKEVNKLANLYKNLTGKAIEDKSAEEEVNKQKKEAEKRKKEQEKLNEDLLSLRRQNQQAEIDLMEEGTEKKLKQIDLDYQKELDAIKKQEKELSEKQKGKLTSEQSIEISNRYTNTENKRDKAIADITKKQLKAEQQALNDYLKEYGTFQQQKFAIAQEYAEKIKKVQEESGANSAQVKLLEKQRDVAIQNKETEAIKANIDWVTVFGEFGSMFNDMIKPALEEAKKYVQTDKFKSSDQDSQKALIDAINQMEQSLGGAGGLNFKKLGQDIKTYQLAEQNRLAAIEEETMAHDKLAKAQDDYTKALKSGTEEEKKAAQNTFEIAQQNANAASMNVQAQTSAANEMQQSLTNTATALKANMENVTSGLQKLASGGIKNAYEGLLQIGKGAGGAMEKFADKLDKVPIVGWIISIIDVFKDGLSNFVGTLLDSVFNAVSGILSDVLSGDLFVTLGKSIRDGVSNIFNAISFGGFDTLINKISGSNAKEVQEAIDRLTDRNETLEKSIDRLTDVMDKSAGSKSISAYEQAYKYQKEQIDNTLKIAREQARYSNSHHSWQYYMGWNDEQLRWVRENVDKNFSGTNSLWGLTPEQMRELLSNADIYEQIKSSGKGGYGERVMEKLEAYADQAGKLDELTEKINESLMQISFDGLRDNFLESLMDMDKDAKSFSEDFTEYMQRALLNFSMGELFDDELREWYNGIAKLMKENGGKLTKQQLEDARKEYDAMVQDAINERDKIAEITGYTGSSSSSQEASKKGFATASQDSIDELNGRFTALQIAGEEIKSQNQLQTMSILELRADMLPIIANTTGIKDIASETRDLLRLSYEAIVDIRDNTNVIVKPIQQMASDIAEVKRNTSKL